MSRTVHCARLQKDLPGLDKAPYPGALGQRIYEQVSQQAWDAWLKEEYNIINHHGLVLTDPKAQDQVTRAMEAFLFPADGAAAGESADE